MAFDMSTFQPAAGGSRGGRLPGVHAYVTTDSATAVAAANYFNGAATLLTAGDLIYRVTVNGAGVPQSAGLHVVTAVAAGTVTVSPATVLALA